MATREMELIRVKSYIGQRNTEDFLFVFKFNDTFVYIVLKLDLYKRGVKK